MSDTRPVCPPQATPWWHPLALTGASLLTALVCILALSLAGLGLFALDGWANDALVVLLIGSLAGAGGGGLVRWKRGRTPDGFGSPDGQ